MPVTIPYIDFTVPDDSYTRKLCMNYFYDLYSKVLYYINISSLSENFLLFFPQGECFSMENSYQWKMCFKINNEAFQRKRIFIAFLCHFPPTPHPLQICLPRVEKSQMRKFVDWTGMKMKKT